MERKKIGLALSGGAARGMAHLGVLKVLTEHNIPIDVIVGTSAGSFAGGAFAAGMTVEQITELARKMTWFNMSKVSFSTEALLTNEPLGKFIKDNFPVQKFEDLPIPLAVVAADLETGEEVVFKDKGDLAQAIRASCAIPGVYRPVVDAEGRKLVDGGIVAALPTRFMHGMGADAVIGVDVNAAGIKFWGARKTALGVLLQSAMLALANSSKFQHKFADVIIVPKVAHLRFDELSKIDEFIKLGEEAAMEKIEDIKALIS